MRRRASASSTGTTAGFGPLEHHPGLRDSSDTFFYQMAVGSGWIGSALWADRMGSARRPASGCPDEAAGIVASTKWAQSQGRPGVFTGELAQAGIGQNVIAVTPLQLLNAYCTLANGGRLHAADDRARRDRCAGKLVEPYAPSRGRRSLARATRTCRTMRIGAREVITSGHAYNIRDLHLPGALSGKTGHGGVRDADERGRPAVPLVVRRLPAQQARRDRRRPRRDHVLVLRHRAGQRVARGREVLPPAVLQSRPGSAARIPRNFSLVGGELTDGCRQLDIRRRRHQDRGMASLRLCSSSPTCCCSSASGS